MLLVDGADGVQVRVDAVGGKAPQDVKAELIDGGRSAADGRRPVRPAAVANAAVAAPAIVTRAQWGADESLRGRTPNYTGTPKIGFVHHTASTNSYSAETAAAQVRAIYAYHTKVNKWSDIGYNFLVDKFGTVYEGRAGGIDRAVLGAHTGGFNSDSFGVSALGNYDTTDAPGPMVESISQVLAWKLASAYRDPNASVTVTSAGGGTSRYRSGERATVPVVAGHRDVGATACPGRYLYDDLPAIRSRVTELMGPSFFDPVTSPAAVNAVATGTAPDGTTLFTAPAGNVTLTARSSEPQLWKMTVTNSAGTVVRGQSGHTTGQLPGISATWNRTVNGQPAPAGLYTLRLTGTTEGGAPVAPYVSTFNVKASAQAPVVAPPKPVVKDPPIMAKVYTDAGDTTYNGRKFSTSCEDFGALHRCSTYVTATYYAQGKGKVLKKYGKVFSGWGYTSPATANWDTSPYATPGEKVIGGKKWKVTCTADSGPRRCRSDVLTKVLTPVKGKGGRVTYKAVEVWKLNRYVRLTVVR
nr:N-acetylmuramoyl-L-alanine amidase [Motilibacter aurantiacus]